MAHNEQHDDSLGAFFRNNLSKKEKGKTNGLWETPSDKVWENVRQRLQEQKKRPVFWLWWLKYGAFAVVALCCVVFGYQIFDDKQTISQLKKQVSQQERDIEILKAEQEKNDEKEFFFNEIQTLSKHSVNDKDEDKNDASNTDFLDEKEDNFENNHTKKASNKHFPSHLFSKQKEDNKSKKYDAKDNFSTVSKRDFFIANKRQINRNESIRNHIFSANNHLNKWSQLAENQNFIKDNSNSFVSSNRSFQKDKNSSVSSNFAASLPISKNQITQANKHSFIFSLPAIATNLLEQDLKHKIEKKKRLKKHKRPKMHKKFHFGVFVGMNHTYRRLVATKDMNTMLSNIEKAQITPKFGSRFSYLLGNNKRFFLETGISFTQFALRSEHQLDLTYDSELATITSMLYKSDIVSCLGNTAANINLRTKENVSANMEDGEIMPWALNSKQSISFLSIPLTARYKFWQTEKLHFSAATSFVSNILTKHKIKLQDSQTEYAHLYLNNIQLENASIINPLSFAVSFNVNAAFQLKNRWEVWLEPSMSYGLTPIFEDNMLKTYPHTIGFQTGINYHFLKDRKRLIFKCW